VKYVVGAPPGPKSRGGVVIVLGGATAPVAGACAAARPGITTAAPAATPKVFMSMRRDITSPRSPVERSWTIAALLHVVDCENFRIARAAPVSAAAPAR
jgi:hypothetical protein